MKRLILSAIWVALICLPVYGQNARLSGVVKDETGAIIVGVKITLRNLNTNAILSTTSSESGLYLLANIPPGKYELRAEHPGFATYKGDLDLAVSQSANIDIVLKVAPIAEEITVTGVAPLIESTKTEISQVIEEKRIVDLPISGRQFTDFVLLSPSVSVGRSLSVGSTGPFTTEDVTKISFAGFSEQGSNLFLVDGADYTNSLAGFQRATPSQEAVKEFRIVNTSYFAEFGRAMGGVVNIITKSGANEFHGSLYEFFRNNALDARNPMTAPQFDVLRQNQFGFTLGGPIVKDKAFFFGNYEGQRKAQSPFYPKFLLDNLEAINRTKRFYSLSEEVLEQLRRENWDQFMLRFDHQTGRNFLMARYNFYDQRFHNISTAPAGLGSPSTFASIPVRDQSLVFNLLSLVSPNFTGEGLFQYARRSFNAISNTGEPNLEIPNVMTFGRSLSFPSFYRETRLQFGGKISYTTGRHAAKFGVDVNHLRDNGVLPLVVNGFIVFSPAGFLGLPPFNQPTPFVFVFGVPTALAGRPLAPRTTNWKILFPTPAHLEGATLPPLHYTFFDFFGQDTWRAAPNFTLDFGLRYMLQTRPAQGFIDSDLNNFQPRLGFAYSFNRSFVLRGGFGVFHAPMHLFSMVTNFVYSNGEIEKLRGIIGAAAEGFSRIKPRGITVGPIPIPQFTVPAVFNYLTRGEYPAGPLIESVFNHVVFDFPNPYSLQWSLQIERELSRDLSLGIGYQGTRGVKMITYRQINVVPIGKLPNGKTQYTLRNFNFAFYHEIFPGNTSHYHGGMITLQKRFSHGFSLNANYTFSKTIDLVQSGSVITFKDGPEDPMNLRANRALSNLHVGQRFVLTFLGEGPKKSFLEGFKLGSIITLQSAPFYTLFAGFDVNGDIESGTDRVGTIGRNTFRGDNFINFDFRLSRVVKISERMEGEFIAEFFNLFNTVNVTAVDTVYGAPDFIGPIPKKFGEPAVAPLSSFGAPQQVSNARQIQFAFKLRW
jgi:hypothetical protein